MLDKNAEAWYNIRMIRFEIDNDEVEKLEIGGNTATLSTDVAILCSTIYYLLKDLDGEETAECFKDGVNILAEGNKLFLKRENDIPPSDGSMN